MCRDPLVLSQFDAALRRIRPCSRARQAVEPTPIRLLTSRRSRRPRRAVRGRAAQQRAAAGGLEATRGADRRVVAQGVGRALDARSSGPPRRSSTTSGWGRSRGRAQRRGARRAVDAGGVDDDAPPGLERRGRRRRPTCATALTSSTAAAGHPSRAQARRTRRGAGGRRAVRARAARERRPDPVEHRVATGEDDRRRRHLRPARRREVEREGKGDAPPMVRGAARAAARIRRRSRPAPRPPGALTEPGPPSAPMPTDDDAVTSVRHHLAQCLGQARVPRAPRAVIRRCPRPRPGKVPPGGRRSRGRVARPRRAARRATSTRQKLAAPGQVRTPALARRRSRSARSSCGRAAASAASLGSAGRGSRARRARARSPTMAAGRRAGAASGAAVTA